MNVTSSQNTVTISDTELSGYKYIHVLQHVKVADDGLQNSNFSYTSSSFTLAYDGYYQITQIKLPTTPGTYYYILEGVTDQIIDPNGDVISLDTLLEVDPTGTTIVKTDQDYFTTYLLHEEYISLLTNKFVKNMCNCDCISKQDKLTIDTISMGLDLITVLSTYFKYNEAERIVEMLYNCLSIAPSNCNCNG